MLPPMPLTTIKSVKNQRTFKTKTGRGTDKINSGHLSSEEKNHPDLKPAWGVEWRARVICQL